MRVLVTGGAGFIGSHIADALLARGDDVLVLDDLASGRAGRLDPQLSLHKVSITDAEALNDEVAAFGPELICHLAAQIDVRASVDAPAADAGVNILGTVNLLEAARRAGARVLFASTGGALYGRDAPIPSLEDVLPLPESPYGIAKYCAECYIGLYNRLHGTRHSVLRLANVYGPRQDPSSPYSGVLSVFMKALLEHRAPTIYGDGEQSRDFTYVEDVATLNLKAATAPGVSGKMYNGGNGDRVTINRAWELLQQFEGVRIPPIYEPARPGDVRDSQADTTAAVRDLGHAPRYSFEEGLRLTIEWYRSQH